MEYRIRVGRKKDLKKIVKLGSEFASTTSSYGYGDQDLEAIANKCLADGLIFVAEQGRDVVGMLGGFFAEVGLMGGVVFHEAAWYVTPEHRGCGKALFDEMERVVKESGARAIVMAAYSNEFQKVVERHYKAHGYKDIEHHWLKRL